MSGLLALLDDVAAIAKVAAAQVDDISGQAAKVGGKTVGIVVDDAAVTPKYVTGLPAARELPIIWKIARASFFNKLVILLPVALLLNAFLPQLITPLLMLGGAYLSFEGAEKVLSVLRPHAEDHSEEHTAVDAAHLEEQRVKGAIKTDFILSAEIMTISLSAVETDGWMATAAILAVVAIGITVLVYGAVAALVKMDDAGLKLARVARTEFGRRFGYGLVKQMPLVMKVISTIGTIAMLWVGGSILVHGVDVLGWNWPYQTIYDIAKSVAPTVGVATDFVEWAVTAFLDGIIALLVGFALIPITEKFVIPFAARLFPEKDEAGLD